MQRLSDLMVEGGKGERVQKLLDTFGIDESAVGHQDFRKLYDEEGPIWIEPRQRPRSDAGVMRPERMRRIACRLCRVRPC